MVVYEWKLKSHHFEIVLGNNLLYTSHVSENSYTAIFYNCQNFAMLIWFYIYLSIHMSFVDTFQGEVQASVTFTSKKFSISGLFINMELHWYLSLVLRAYPFLQGVVITIKMGIFYNQTWRFEVLTKITLTVIYLMSPSTVWPLVSVQISVTQ